MTYPVVVINHAHLRDNIRLLSDMISPSQVMLAVKTNAYGHGIVEVCQTALQAAVGQFAVLEVSAGVTLRRAGITVPLFAWLFADDEVSDALQNDIDLGVSRREHLDRIADVNETRVPLRVHLKIDTGLTRNGALPSQWGLLCEKAAELEKSGHISVVGVWTHLADASPEDDEESLQIFTDAVAQARETGLAPTLLHIGASSAGLRFPAGRGDAVRFGIAAYGISPFDSPSSSDLGLKPVMTMTSTVIRVENGHAVVRGGFGDGIPVGMNPERYVTLGESKYRVDAVTVDEMSISPFYSDSSPWPVNVGDQVVVFGEGGPSAEQLGAWCNTIGDEVVTGIPMRIPRSHINQ